MITNVITHAGTFHADEILAVAILKIAFPGIEVTRKFKITSEEYNNPAIAIVDVGRYYDPSKSLFDHHQDKTLHASNLLILDTFYLNLGVKFELNTSESYRMYMHLTKTLFMYVSNVDKGIIREDGKTPTFNSIIRNMNALREDVGFELAVTMAEITIESYINSLQLIIEGEKVWDTFSKVAEGVKLQEDLNIIPNWKEIAKQEGVIALVQPNIRGGWQVVSRDTNHLVLPKTEEATFRHNSGFMTVFEELSQAKDYARNLKEFYHE